MKVTDHGIHMLPSDPAVRTFQAAFPYAADRLLVDSDSLAFGPTTHFNDIADWNAARAEFWRGVYRDQGHGGEDVEDWLLDDDDEDADSADSGAALPPNRAPAKDAEAVYLWTGTGVDDQLSTLFAIQILSRCEGFDMSKLRLVQYESLPRFTGAVASTSWLNPEDMCNHPAPTELSPAQIAECRAAWLAYTAPDPELLQEFVAAETCNMLHLLPTLRLVLRRYPRRDTGLSHWDYLLLRNAAEHAPSAVRTIGETVGDLVLDGDSWSDVYLFHRMQKMASNPNPHPLMQLHGDTTMYRNTEVTVTDFGRAVLEGRASAYPTNPIDEWIGGVHLSSAEDRLWFYEDGILHRHRIET